MNIGGRKQQEMLLTGNDGVEILVVVLVERGLGEMVANPKINSFGEASEGVGGPRDVSVAVLSQRRVLGPEAVVLLLGIRHEIGGMGIDDEIKSFREGHAQGVCGGEAEGRWVFGIYGDGSVGSAIGGKVEGDMSRGEGSSEVGIVGPGGEGGPVKSGVGDNTRLVRGHEVSEEF